jgi:hypothetical protein
MKATVRGSFISGRKGHHSPQEGIYQDQKVFKFFNRGYVGKVYLPVGGQEGPASLMDGERWGSDIRNGIGL